MSERTVMTKEEFRLLFLQWCEKTRFISSPHSMQVLIEHAILREQLSLNKPMCLSVLFEELEEYSWNAMMLIHSATRRQSQRIHLPEHIRGQLYPVLDRYYRYAIGRGYTSPKIREGQSNVRTRLNLERDIKDVIRRLSIMKSEESWEKAKSNLLAIASHDKDRLCRFLINKYLHLMGNIDHLDRPKLVRFLSDVLSSLWGEPEGLKDAVTSLQIYTVWFNHFKDNDPT